MDQFEEITELAGDEVSAEQVQRVCTRYAWALDYCRSKDVLEIACGTGPGLGLLQSVCRSVVGGDISESILARARGHYGRRVDLRVLNAEALPFADESLDAILIFEALYYLHDASKFARECQRVLRRGGHLLISNANKDLFDFSPSAFSKKYHGVVELEELFGEFGFSVRFWGDLPIKSVSWRQKVLRPLKRIAVMSGLMPKTADGKKILKRLVFGRMHKFPPEILPNMIEVRTTLTLLANGEPDRSHKVILCAATKS